MNHLTLPPVKQISREYVYNPLTGAFFYLREPREGQRAGFMIRGRRYLYLNGKSFLASRIAWILMTGEDPAEKDIDHINGDPSDDRWSNLRAISHRENLMNRRAYTRKDREGQGTGYKGVYRAKNSKSYYASICIQKKMHYLGTFKDPREAAYAVAKWHAENGTIGFQPQSMRDLLFEGLEMTREREIREANEFVNGPRADAESAK